MSEDVSNIRDWVENQIFSIKQVQVQVKPQLIGVNVQVKSKSLNILSSEV